jgi:Family of unknown function (DUF6157)
MALYITKTFVAVADDCPAASAITPSPKGGKATVAALQYTLEDLIFEVHLARSQIPEQERKLRGDEIRAELFSRSHACMRASPLTKSYGWGAHYDEDGRLALYPRESRQYARLSTAKDLDVVKAMRNRRA